MLISNKKKRMVKKLNKLLNFNIKDKTIAILGLAFKPNTDDVRESPAKDIINSILDHGGFINAYDPVANDAMSEVFPEINYCDSWRDACENADAVVLITEWNEFRGIDLNILKQILSSPLILDTRNIFSVDKLKNNGFIYDNVGRNNIK